MFRTRIAPSPTGDMHIGTARTAYFNWLAARASGGSFLLRIDDTDPARSKPEYTAVIVETMRWLGLDYDEMVHQSRRGDIYHAHLRSLSDAGCTRIGESGAVLLNLPADRKCPESWTDDLAGEVRITADDIAKADGSVLVRSDGTPTYNFASVVDDIAWGVNYVIRGVDHVTNTAKQVILYTLLGLAPPRYAHVGLICMDGKPLSKRDGAAGMLYYRDKGYDSDAVLNFLARLGWGPTKDDKTTRTLPRERMLELFLTGGKMRASAANMDLHKLEAYDRKYKAAKGVWRTGGKLIG